MDTKYELKSIIVSLKKEYIELCDKTKLAIKYNLQDNYINDLIFFYLNILSKFKASKDLISCIISNINRKKITLIQEKLNIKSNLDQLYDLELLITNKLNNSNDCLVKYRNLSCLDTTEKNIIQTSIHISKTIKQPDINNLIANDVTDLNYFKQYNYAFPSEFNEVKQSSLFINKEKRCLDPVINPSDSNIIKGTTVFIRYPTAAELNISTNKHSKVDSNVLINNQSDKDYENKCEDVFFKYLIFDSNEGVSNKVPSFCNGLKYDNKGIEITNDVTLKVVACSRYMLDSNVITMSYCIKSIGDNYLINDRPEDINPQREAININKGGLSDIRPETYNDDSSPTGTDGSFHTGSILKRNSLVYDGDEDEL